MDGVRTHDAIYLKENYKLNPKEYYKFIKAEIEKKFAGKSMSILDVGCETGSFLHYLHKSFPNAKLTGMDVMQELLDEVNLPDIGANTIKCDISNSACIPDKKYDVITMMGVLGIFDDYKVVLDNLMSMIKNNGIVYIFSCFNPENVDMLMRCRMSGDDGVWEKGWNVFSLASLKKHCEANGWKFDIKDFHMPFRIKKNKNDILRSWTVDINGELSVINGLQLIHYFYLFSITKGE